MYIYLLKIILIEPFEVCAANFLSPLPNLFGKLEYENQMGSIKTDHTMLKPGVFHKANGGYLLVNARDLITNMAVWEAFKRVLRNSELTIDASRDMATTTTIVTH